MSDSNEPGTEIVRVSIGSAEVQLSDPSGAQEAIMERILESPTLEAIFEVAGTLNADDVDRRPFYLIETEFFKSAHEDGPGAYAIMKVAFIDTGETGVITCGGVNVVAQLIAASKYDPPGFPIQLERNLRPTAKGFYPLWLHRADAVAAA